MAKSKVKKMNVADGDRVGIGDCPNIHKTGSVTQMRRKYWGSNALVVRCGNYYYNVTEKPEIYEQAA